MTREDCFYFGQIVKAFGYEGAFMVKADVDDLAQYKKLKSVFIDLNGTLTPFFISELGIRDKEFIWFKADGFNTSDDISNLLKKDIFLPLELLPKLKGNKFYFHEIPGFTVIDEKHGDIGIVKDVVELPHQSIIQVIKNYKEILIPITKDIIKEVDRDNKTIKICATEGLIELYLETNNDEQDDDFDE